MGWVGPLLQLVGTLLLAIGVLLRLQQRGWFAALWHDLRRVARRLVPRRWRPGQRVAVGAAPATSSASAGQARAIVGRWEDWSVEERVEELRHRLDRLEPGVQQLRERVSEETKRARDERNELRTALRAVERDVDDVAVGHAGIEVFGLLLLLSGLLVDAAGALVAAFDWLPGAGW